MPCPPGIRSRLLAPAVACALCAASAAAGAPRLQTHDPLSRPAPSPEPALSLPASNERPEEKIVPGLRRRLIADDESDELAVIIELHLPVHRSSAAAHSARWDGERAALSAAIEHRFAARAHGLVAGLRGLSHFPIVFGRVSRADLLRVAALPEVWRVYEDSTVRALRVEGGSLVGATALRLVNGATGLGIGVAVLDTGIDDQHPELAGRVVVQADYTGTTGDGTIDDHGHGTRVSGILAGATGGMAPRASLWALKVLKADGLGKTSGILQGLNDAYARRRESGGLDLVNLSLGGEGPFDSHCDGVSPYNSVFNALHAAGIAIFAASGNDGSDTGIIHPACHSKAIAVGAVYDADIGPLAFFDVCTDPDTAPDQITCYANSGRPLAVFAPAHCARTPMQKGGHVLCFGGTSASAPYAAGVAAQLLELHKGTRPARLKSVLMSTGKPLTTPSGITRNRIDAVSAHQVLGGGGPAGPCVQDATTACLLNGRFKALVRFRGGFDNGLPDRSALRKEVSGFANPSFETAFFYFNNPDNIEVMLKVLDQGNTNPQGQPTIAVLYGSATPLRTELTVVDTETGAVRSYTSPFRSHRGGTDFTAFVK